MNLNYDINKISLTLQDFFNATGINILLLDSNFSTISQSKNAENNYCKCIKKTVTGRKTCIVSDRELFKKCSISRKPEIHTCHAGLIDIAVPLIYEKDIIGYIILGQMKKDDDFEVVKEYTEKLGIKTSEIEPLYNSLTKFDSGKIQSIENIAAMLAKYLLLENLLKPYSYHNIEAALAYIHNNLDTALSIQSISENINLSKSSLYKYFHKRFNCTVNEYINSKRIEKAIKLVIGTDLSIEEISRMTGFASGAYFTRVFKKETGTTPLKYRKNA